MKLQHLASGAILGIILLLTPACQEGTPETGRIIVQITDEPFPIDQISEANVTITKVEIRSAEAEAEEEAPAEDTDDSTSPFITLYEDSIDINLLELRNGITAELTDLEIPAGEYDLIRVYVASASITLTNEETYTVKVPSGSQTGVKLFVSPALKVSGDQTAEVLLDFSVEKSFVLQGDLENPAGIKGFSFKPVIRVVNNAEAGAISGEVTEADTEAPISGAAVSLVVDGEDITTYSDADGYYAILGIPAGFYIVNAEREGYTSLTTNEIEIEARNATTKNFKLSVVPTF